MLLWRDTQVLFITRSHSEFSNNRLRDCINRIPELIDYAIELGHSGIAFTEHESVAGFVKIEKEMKRISKTNPNFKIIRGNEIYLTRNNLTASSFNKERGDGYYHFILLAKDLEGYHQICELSTRAWTRSYVSNRMRRVPTYYEALKEIAERISPMPYIPTMLGKLHKIA